MNRSIFWGALLLVAAMAGGATGALITSYAVKATPVGADKVLLIDSADPAATKTATLESLGAAVVPPWLPSTGPTADNQIIQATGAGVSAWTSIVDGLINDAGTGTDDLWSASKITVMFDLYDKRQPETFVATSDVLMSESEMLSNKYMSNYGALGTVKITMPAVSYRITRTGIVESAQSLKICPPSGEALNVNGSSITVDHCMISPVMLGSKTTITRRRDVSGWIYDVDGVRGTWATGP